MNTHAKNYPGGRGRPLGCWNICGCQLGVMDGRPTATATPSGF